MNLVKFDRGSATIKRCWAKFAKISADSAKFGQIRAKVAHHWAEFVSKVVFCQNVFKVFRGPRCERRKRKMPIGLACWM